MTDGTPPPVRDQPVGEGRGDIRRLIRSGCRTPQNTTIPFVVMERPAAGGETV